MRAASGVGEWSFMRYRCSFNPRIESFPLTMPFARHFARIFRAFEPSRRDASD
jgi:hypothetical protein